MLRPRDVGWELPVWLSNTIYLVVGFGCFLALQIVIGVWALLVAFPVGYAAVWLANNLEHRRSLSHRS
jgi:hypothetical protein